MNNPERHNSTTILCAVCFTLAIPFYLVVVSVAAEDSVACLVKDYPAWLDHIAAGRYDHAQAMITTWRGTEGCACPDAKTACIKIPSKENQAGPPYYLLAPMDLANMVQSAAEWEKRARAMCDPLLGSDAIGFTARNACLQRKVEKMGGIKDEMARVILSPALKMAAKRLENENASGIVEVEDIRPMDTPSINSNIQRRALVKARQLASEICAMQKEIVESEERAGRIKRQPRKLARDKRKNLHDEQQFAKRLKEAVARSKNEFKRLARRDFNPLVDCMPKKLPEIE